MKKIISVVFIALFSFGILSAQTVTRAKQFNTENGLAIQGYDKIAYFTLNKAVEGQKKHVVSAEGIKYYFSTEANKNLFLKDCKK